MVKTANELIEEAFRRLKEKPGFVERENQSQLAWLISDCIEGRQTGIFEAPTGLGKSLAALIPAIAHCLAANKRVVVATYTNVLAEQYWQKDWPLAASLFDEKPSAAFLMGRQRYACLLQADEHEPGGAEELEQALKMGIESEYRHAMRQQPRKLAEAWSRLATPPVCPGRLCAYYGPCFYYSARRRAERANLVITNHNVVLQDALIKRTTQGDMTMLGDYDFLIVDEAHDMLSAAHNALEFELSEGKLATMAAISHKVYQCVRNSPMPYLEGPLARAAEAFRRELDQVQLKLVAYQEGIPGAGILKANPEEVEVHPTVKPHVQRARLEIAEALAEEAAQACHHFVRSVDGIIQRPVDDGFAEAAHAQTVREATSNYSAFVTEFGVGCHSLFHPFHETVTHVGRAQDRAQLRRDPLDVAEELRALVWDQVPSVSMSATLALDGSFDFFVRCTGVQGDFQEILPSPFDFSSQAAVYVPALGAIPDPSVARREGREEDYFGAIARELSEIITLMRGRTLALFHSRREMQEVFSRMNVPPDLPILLQRPTGAGSVGEQFKRDIGSSLFALRSFWTGFDAPGETCSCVVVVRVPFEVPVEPTQIARSAQLMLRGLDPFMEWSLPQAKMMMRQGAGRLIRNDADRGLLCLLDPRLKAKRYGEQILDNLPSGMREFNDAADAIGYLGLG